MLFFRVKQTVAELQIGIPLQKYCFFLKYEKFLLLLVEVNDYYFLLLFEVNDYCLLRQEGNGLKATVIAGDIRNRSVIG